MAVVRNGVRLVAYGSGEGGRLRLGNIPTSSDVKVGDELITSGLGGRFPAGFMVVTLFCFNFLGDGLRDALDPKDR